MPLLMLFALIKHTTSSIYYKGKETLLDFEAAASALRFETVRKKINWLCLTEIGQDNVEDLEFSILHSLC